MLLVSVYLVVGLVLGIVHAVVWQRGKSDKLSFIFFPLNTNRDSVGWGTIGRYETQPVFFHDDPWGWEKVLKVATYVVGMMIFFPLKLSQSFLIEIPMILEERFRRRSK